MLTGEEPYTYWYIIVYIGCVLFIIRMSQCFAFVYVHVFCISVCACRPYVNKLLQPTKLWNCIRNNRHQFSVARFGQDSGGFYE